IVGRREIEVAAKGVDMVVAQFLADIAFAIAVTAGDRGRDASRELLIGGWRVDGTLEFHRAAAADGQIGITTPVHIGALGDHADRAAGVVLAEQRTLRALEYLDALDVEKRRTQTIDARIVHFIDINADRLVAGERA